MIGINGSSDAMLGRFTQSYPLHTTLVIICDDKYELSGGHSSTIVCRKDGTWSRMMTTCAGIEYYF